jgi:hypothetical protein
MVRKFRLSLWIAAVFWIATVLALTGAGYALKRQGVFVRQTLPIGTSWQGYQIAIPGRPAITITEEERLCRNSRFAERDVQGGEGFLFPKESPWACIKNAPVYMSIRWPQFSLAIVFGLLGLMAGLRPTASKSSSGVRQGDL